MAGKVCFSVSMSLFGYTAPAERRDDTDVRGWMAQRIVPQRFFRENLKPGEQAWPEDWRSTRRSSCDAREA